MRESQERKLDYQFIRNLSDRCINSDRNNDRNAHRRIALSMTMTGTLSQCLRFNRTNI